MSFLGKLFGKESGQDSHVALSSEQIEKVLLELRDNDSMVRLVAMRTAARLLGQGEPGALKPYLVTLSDQDDMLRGAVVNHLAQAATDEVTKAVLRNTVKNSEEGRTFLKMLKDLSMTDPEPLIREDARQALDHILKA